MFTEFCKNLKVVSSGLSMMKNIVIDLKNINDAVMSLNESDLLHAMLYGSKKFDNNMNMSLLTATIKFIKDTGRFDQPLF